MQTSKIGNEYRAENVFFVPASARWNYLCSRAKTPEIGKGVDAAMDAVERDNPSLRGVLPKVYARGNLDRQILVALNDISIYGQESNQTTWRLAKMNLAIRGIDSSQVRWNNEGSFLNDAHKDLKADYIIANPPFNDSDWSGDLLHGDGRWQYGEPPSSNATTRGFNTFSITSAQRTGGALCRQKAR